MCIRDSTNPVALIVPTTCSFAVGLQVPIPALPFITVKPPTGVVVPIPVLPSDVMSKRLPSPVAVDDTINGAVPAAVLTISSVDVGVVVPIPTLSVVVDGYTLLPPSLQPPADVRPVNPEPSPTKAVALTVPMTCNFTVGVVVPIPTLLSLIHI